MTCMREAMNMPPLILAHQTGDVGPFACGTKAFLGEIMAPPAPAEDSTALEQVGGLMLLSVCSSLPSNDKPKVSLEFNIIHPRNPGTQESLARVLPPVLHPQARQERPARPPLDSAGALSPAHVVLVLLGASEGLGEPGLRPGDRWRGESVNSIGLWCRRLSAEMGEGGH